VQGFFSGINNPKEWHNNNHRGGVEVIIVISEGCLFHWRICSNACLSYLDNGLWSLEFVMHPRRMQFVYWSFVARCLNKFHLVKFCLTTIKPCILCKYQSILCMPLSNLINHICLWQNSEQQFSILTLNGEIRMVNGVLLLWKPVNFGLLHDGKRFVTN